jgi:outer membrane protein OmpA-like peptidoglycan-associated protein
MTRRLAPWLLGALLVSPGAAWAQEATDTVKPEDVKTWTFDFNGKEWSARTAAPSYEGDTGLFRLSSAYTLPKGRLSFSLFRDNYDRDPKGVDFSIHGLTIGYGATDRLEIFGNLGIQNRAKVNYPFEAGFPNDYPFIGSDRTSPGWQTGFGDIKVGAKYAFLNDYTGDAVGLAVKGLVKFGTADEALGLGTGKTSFGADLVLSKTLNKKADLHASIGYLVNGSPDEVAVGDAFKWGVGLNVPACTIFQLQAEVVGWNISGDDDFAQTNPVDLVVGASIWIKPGLFIRPAFSYAMNYDGRGRDVSGAKRSGRQISIGYHPGTPCCEVYVPPPPPPPPANRPPTVSLDCTSPIMQGETSACRATASDPDGDPLTYAWSVSTGNLSGDGAQGTFNSAGVTCDSTVTVTVEVSDGRGGTAKATDTIKVECPPPAEPITCTSGGFPRNLSRLNNVDKACLDDVATRLQRDPKARVVIVGHADSRERYPEVVGRTRAEAVKAYLVSERGVEESRISTRSAAATKPIDTGTTPQARAKNRRVEVIFLPEGAQVPEDDD